MARFEVGVLGAGKIGKLIASNLKYDTFNTVLISRNISSQIRFYLHTKGEKTRFKLNCKEPSSINYYFDFVWVTTKAQNVYDALQSIQKNINTDTIIILSQNGLGFHTQISNIFPKNTILLAPISYGVKIIDNKDIASCMKGTVMLGNYQGVLLAKHKDAILQNIHLNIKWSSDIQKEIELKFAINCIINPLSVIYNCSNGELLLKPGFKDISSNLAYEINNCLINKETISKEKILTKLYIVLENTTNNISSTLSDYKNRTQNELEFLNMHLTKLANKNSIKLKTNYVILAALSYIGVNNKL